MLVGRIDDVLVNFVGDDVSVVFLRQIGDQGQLFSGKDLTAGVRGVAEDQSLCPLPESGFQLVRVKGKLRRVKGDVNGFRPGKDGVGAVIFIKGRKKPLPYPRDS